MKTYIEIPVPATTRTHLSETKCDLCGTTTRNEWCKNSYDAVESDVRLKTGTSYPEGGSGEETTIDICPDCFKSKLIPWVVAQGGQPTTKEWDW